MRFIGSKRYILENIYEFIAKKDMEAKTFCDIFSGTTCVASFFKKKGYQVISNDIVYFSYVLQKAYIENDSYPLFTRLLKYLGINKLGKEKDRPLKKIVEYLNNLPGKKGFIFNNYSSEGTSRSKVQRMYFTGRNAQKIDSIRQKIEEWNTQGLISENEYFILLALLIEAIPFVSNISGTYGAFLKHWDPRAHKELNLKMPEIAINGLENKTYNVDSVKLAKKIKCDILYLDPPYNSRQYAPNYHILETVARYDNPHIKGVTGMRNYTDQKSQFCKRETATEALKDIAKNGNCDHLILSYNDEGLMADSDIRKALSVKGRVEVKRIKYRRFKSHSRGSEHVNKRAVHELLYYVKAGS